MTASEKLIAFIRNTFDTALYFAVMAVKENFRNYIRRAGPTGDPSRGMVILGNGPSLAEDLPRLIARREYEARDFMAVNFLPRTTASRWSGRVITSFPTRCSSATASAATAWPRSTARSIARSRGR